MAEKRSAGSKEKVKKEITYATPALEKGLDVIELLAHQRDGLTISEIARGLNRTVSEIFRMLVTLRRRGYIAQVSEERFSLTLKLFKLVQEHPPTARLIADALPVMNWLAHETMQSCHMGVLEAGNVVIIAQVNAPTNIGFYVKLGSTVDLMESASGYVLLANQTDAQRALMLDGWARATGKTSPKDLHVHLSRIRKAGFEKRDSYLVKGVVNISFPVFDDRGAAISALTVPFIQHADSAIRASEVIEAMRRSAEEITEAIGGAASGLRVRAKDSFES